MCYLAILMYISPQALSQLELDIVQLTIALNRERTRSARLAVYVGMVQYHLNTGKAAQFLNAINVHKEIDRTDEYYSLMRKALRYGKKKK